jgi:putative tricarboxylic transport membrane protein
VEEETEKEKVTSGLSHGIVDALVAGGMFVVGAVMVIDNYRLGAGWAADGPESGYFPLRIGVIICICSAALLMQWLFSKKRNSDVFVSGAKFRPVLMVLIPTTVYVLAIQLLGMYVASTVFIAAFMRVMGKFSWLKTVVVSIGVSATLFWMFELQFLVPLAKGPLEALFGY